MKNSVDKGEKGCYIMQAVAWDTRRKTWAEASELLQNRIEQNSENDIRKTKFEKTWKKFLTNWVERDIVIKLTATSGWRCTLKIKHCKTKCKEHFSLSKT